MTRPPRQLAASFAVVASLMSFPSAWAADKLASADASMLKEIAEANIAEIETGKIADPSCHRLTPMKDTQPA